MHLCLEQLYPEDKVYFLCISLSMAAMVPFFFYFLFFSSWVITLFGVLDVEVYLSLRLAHQQPPSQVQASLIDFLKEKYFNFKRSWSLYKSYS